MASSNNQIPSPAASVSSLYEITANEGGWARDIKFERPSVTDTGRSNLMGWSRFHPVPYSLSANPIDDPNTHRRGLLLHAVRDRVEAGILQGQDDSTYLEGTGRLLRESLTVKETVQDMRNALCTVT